MTSSVSRLVEYVDSPMIPEFARTATTPRDAVNSIITVKSTRITVVTRTVDEKQHYCDHRDGDQGDLQGAFAAHLELIGDQRRGAGDIGLDPGRRRRVVHDVAHRIDGLIGQTSRPDCRRDTPAPTPPCRRRSASPPPSADPPRNPGCARRASCLGRAFESGRRSSGARRHRAADRPPGRSSPRCRNRTRETPCRCVYWPAATAHPGGSATRCVLGQPSPIAARKHS